MIALLCAVPAETEFLTARISSRRTRNIAPLAIAEGSLGGHDIVLCAGGMGKVNAAHAATMLILHYQPETLLVFGIGGAYPSSGAGIGDIAVAREEIAGDEGVLTPDGFKDTEHIGIPLVTTASSVIYTTYPAPAGLLERSCRSLAGSPSRVHTGTFVTLSTCTGTAARARELEERYHGLCENMEGAAAAQVAAHHNVPWLELRGISNIVEDRDLSRWDIPKAADAVQRAVLQVLAGWEG